MGCNCKMKKMEKKFPSIITPTYNKQGIGKFLDIIKQRLWKLLGCIIVIIFMILAIPFVALMVIYNYVRHGELMFSIPFLDKPSERKKKYLEKITQKEV